MDDLFELIAHFIGLVVTFAVYGLALFAAGWLVLHVVRFIAS